MSTPSSFAAKDMININHHAMAANNNPVINRIVILTLLSYPILLLTVQGGMNGLLFLAFLVSLFYLFRRPKSLANSLWDSYSIAFAFAMASPLFAVFLSEAYHGAFTAPPFDGPSRFLLVIPVFLALRQMEMHIIAYLQYGLPLGALSALFGAMFAWPKWVANNSYFVNSIHFGNLALMLGFLSLFSINWVKRDSIPVLVLKIISSLVGIFVSIQSDARGGWIAFPALFFVWWISHNPKNSWVKHFVALLFILLIALLGYELIGIVQHRMDLIYQNLIEFQHGNKDTSIGIRLQLWHAAWYLFSNNPVFGVGPGGYAQMMTPLSNSGMLTPIAASYGRGEVHNEILAKSSELGIFGFLSLMSIYAIPLTIFIRATRTSTSFKRSAAFMGICLVAGFFIFGLTVEIFNLKMTVSFYSLTMAVLLAASIHKPSA
jgi:O-antigen ligase